MSSSHRDLPAFFIILWRLYLETHDKTDEDTTHNTDEESETPLHEAARTPLYDGGSYSILRASL